MPIMEALAAVGQAYEVAKGLRAIEKNFDAAAYKLQVADLMTALGDARMELVNARDTMAEKDAEIDRLKASFEDSRSVKEGRGGYKYQINSAGEPQGYPICPACDAKERRQVKLVQNGHHRNTVCPSCLQKFEGITYYVVREDGEVVSQEQIDKVEQERQSAELARKLGEAGRRLA